VRLVDALAVFFPIYILTRNAVTGVESFYLVRMPLLLFLRLRLQTIFKLDD
jgi:hypothetical protein